MAAVMLISMTADLGVRPAAAQTAPAQTLNTGHYQALDSAGVAQMTPKDGRLAGYGFETDITGVAFASRGGDTTGTPVSAAAGDQLVVVSLSQIMPDQSRYYDYPTDSTPTYTLTAGSATISLGQIDQTVPSAVTKTWAVAIPTGSPATLTATFAGFSQSFDLRAGRRIGTSPTALYRDPTNPAVNVNLSATQTLTATGSPADPVSMQLSPQGATLGYFQPAGTLQPPPPPDQAWLIVDMGAPVVATDSSGSAIDCPGEIGYPNVYLQTPAGQVHPGAALDAGSGSGSCVSEIYGFEVPATLTAATFVVTINGTVGATDHDNPVSLAFQNQTAHISISLPPLPAPLGQGYLTPSASPSPDAGPSPTVAAPRHRAGGSDLPAVIAAILAVVALAILAIWLRLRRRTLPVRPVTRFPRTLIGPPDSFLATASAVEELTTAPGELIAGPPPGISTATEQADPAVTTTATAPPAEDRPALAITLLGPPVVDGLRKAIRRRGVARLLYALALHHSRPVTVAQLRDLVATSDTRSEAAETIISYASILRSASPQGSLPQIGAGQQGYQFDLARVDIDLAVFDALAQQAGDLSTAEQIEAGLTALSLVRGVPLADSGWYGIEASVRDLTSRIERLAADTARTALSDRDARRAEQAIEAGLKAVPASPVLWETRLVAAAAGSGYGLHRAWADAQKALGPDAPMLAPTFQRLAQGDF